MADDLGLCVMFQDSDFRPMPHLYLLFSPSFTGGMIARLCFYACTSRRPRSAARLQECNRCWHMLHVSTRRIVSTQDVSDLAAHHRPEDYAWPIAIIQEAPRLSLVPSYQGQPECQDLAAQALREGCSHRSPEC